MTDDRPVVTTLTPKQQKFKDYFLIYLNATKAAELAGYAHPNKRGPELLKNPQIADAIENNLRETAMSAEEVLARLSEHARSDIGEFLDMDGNLDLKRMKSSGMTRLVKKLNTSKSSGTSPKGGDWERETVTLELHDAQSALTTLARYHGLLGSKGTEDDPVHSVGMSLDEWRAEVARRREQAAATEALFDDETPKN